MLIQFLTHKNEVLSGGNMSLIRISESDNWIAEYDRERGMYRVSYFQDGHFVDGHWFDAYEEKEVKDVVRCENCAFSGYRASGKNLWCDIFDKIMPENGYCCFGDNKA